VGAVRAAHAVDVARDDGVVRSHARARGLARRRWAAGAAGAVDRLCRRERGSALAQAAGAACGGVKPSVVAHSDWGASASSRWCARAALGAGGAYRASAPEPVGDLRTFVRRAAPAGSTLLGFDFPIGLPAWYAAAIGVTSFVDFLRELASGGRAGFYEVAASPAEISLERPFYPARPGGATHR